MGMDCYAYAVWGLKTTRAAVHGAYTEEKTWIGAEGVTRTEFDPTTGRPNYRVTRKAPPEIDEDISGRVLSVGSYDSDEVVLPLRKVETRSHRYGAEPVEADPEPPPEELATFRATMQRLGLWEKGKYGHWVFMYISV